MNLLIVESDREAARPGAIAARILLVRSSGGPAAPPREIARPVTSLMRLPALT